MSGGRTLRQANATGRLARFSPVSTHSSSHYRFESAAGCGPSWEEIALGSKGVSAPEGADPALTPPGPSNRRCGLIPTWRKGDPALPVPQPPLPTPPSLAHDGSRSSLLGCAELPRRDEYPSDSSASPAGSRDMPPEPGRAPVRGRGPPSSCLLYLVLEPLVVGAATTTTPSRARSLASPGGTPGPADRLPPARPAAGWPSTWGGGRGTRSPGVHSIHIRSARVCPCLRASNGGLYPLPERATRRVVA